MIDKLRKGGTKPAQPANEREFYVRGAAGVKGVWLLVAVFRQFEIMTMEALPSLRFEVSLAVIEAKAQRSMC